MKYCFLFCQLLIIQLSFSQNASVKEAYQFLNQVRANPEVFSKDVGISLKGIKKMPALKWNDTLARVAQTKAEDLAKNNYFDHVDLKGYGMNYYVNKAGYKLPKEWLDDPSNNYVESLSAGAVTPKEGIINLLYDEGEKNHLKAGHRNHLLGIDEFYAKATDIGIGWAQNPKSDFGYYLVVVIARHNW